VELVCAGRLPTNITMTPIIKSPALKYYGGKFRLAPWIINHFPAHVYYVEPFAIAESLNQAQIENRDAFRLLFEMDSPDTLFYIPTSIHADKKLQTCEINDTEHRKLAIIASVLKGHVVISGYECPLYKRLFEDKGWTRIDKMTTAGGGAKRTECLWLAPRTAMALSV
jgi:site-specific DNA-adenine methylase